MNSKGSLCIAGHYLRRPQNPQLEDLSCIRVNSLLSAGEYVITILGITVVVITLVEGSAAFFSEAYLQ